MAWTPRLARAFQEHLQQTLTPVGTAPGVTAPSGASWRTSRPSPPGCTRTSPSP
jgi:hypothetical protein